ncbi:RNA-binding domain-containing protein [Desulfonatronovibrio hydrogenovorans]|uniref:RNA-binding domain-containing protein n=1 Tax=Desulfonatronovibrio hydrogenovorans TaxID=53245 RepID=UPI00048ED0F9|nr:RNA-binding domain-containing protein [Desulfonatronovibrio hydrogenovorans]
MNINETIKSPEGRTLEFKSQVPGKLDSILRTVIAFSNGSGGEIIIGIDDDRNIIGIDQDPFDLEERLASSIHDRIAPVPGVFFQTISIDRNVLFRIKVLPGPNKPYYLKSKGPEKGTYIRVGSTNRLADEWVLADLRRQGRNRSLDEEVETRFGCEVFSSQVFSRYMQWRGLQAQADLEYLVKEKLAVRYNGSCHPTVGGLLLFSEILPEPYAYAGFAVVRYSGDSRSSLVHSQAISCALLDMPGMVLDAVGAYLGSKVEISGLHREEQLDIPLLALRESIVNAICHRDYAMQGSQSKVEVFADRVEVISPGTLPTGIAVADLGLGASEIRNRQIVKIFRKAGYIEQLGTGIIRMRESCRDAGLAEPRFEEVGSYFKVTFFKAQNTLPPDLKAVYDFLRKHGEQSSSQIAASLDIHQNTAIKRLNKLLDAGLVVKKGKGADVRYEAQV